MGEGSEIFDATDTAHREQLRAGFRDLAERQRALYTEYRRAGFSEHEALELTIAHSERED